MSTLFERHKQKPLKHGVDLCVSIFTYVHHFSLYL
jgi:hypothetical protein